MIWLPRRVLLLGRGSLESVPNNEAMLLLASPFSGDKAVRVSIFRLFSSGAIDMQKLRLRASAAPGGGKLASLAKTCTGAQTWQMFERSDLSAEENTDGQSPACPNFLIPQELNYWRWDCTPERSVMLPPCLIIFTDRRDAVTFVTQSFASVWVRSQNDKPASYRIVTWMI